jgi:hypothetical protein
MASVLLDGAEDKENSDAKYIMDAMKADELLNLKPLPRLNPRVN